VFLLIYRAPPIYPTSFLPGGSRCEGCFCRRAAEPRTRVEKPSAWSSNVWPTRARIEMPATQIEKNPRVASAMTDVAIHPMTSIGRGSVR
jgi:hypothetical protein